MEKYKTIKLNIEEINFLKEILIERYVNCLAEKENDKENLTLQKNIKISSKLLNIIEYLER